MTRVIEVKSGLFTGALTEKRVQKEVDKHSGCKLVAAERVTSRRLLFFPYQALLLFFEDKD